MRLVLVLYFICELHHVMTFQIQGLVSSDNPYLPSGLNIACEMSPRAKDDWLAAFGYVLEVYWMKSSYVQLVEWYHHRGQQSSIQFLDYQKPECNMMQFCVKAWNIFVFTRRIYLFVLSNCWCYRELFPCVLSFDGARLFSTRIKLTMLFDTRPLWWVVDFFRAYKVFHALLFGSPLCEFIFTSHTLIYSPGIMLLISKRATSHVPLKIISIEDGTVLKSFNHLLHRNKKVDFIEQFNEKLLVKQEDENLQILDVRFFLSSDQYRKESPFLSLPCNFFDKE